MVPEIPVALGIPSPSSQQVIEDYFANYLMDPRLSINETYRYSSRIHARLNGPVPQEYGKRYDTRTQFERVVDMLKHTPLTNQAVIEIGSPEDLAECWGKDGKLDPPCLRLIDFKVLPGRVLTLSCYFRSWDLWAGFPVNLGGLELLKQYVAQETGLENGSMYCYSSGLHIYGYQEELARIRTGITLTSEPS